MRSILAMCAAALLIANPLFAESQPNSADPAGKTSVAADPNGTSGEAAGEEQPQPSNPPPVTDSIVLANGKIRIGAVFFAVEAATSPRMALFSACALFALSILGCAAFLSWMRRANA